MVLSDITQGDCTDGDSYPECSQQWKRTQERLKRRSHKIGGKRREAKKKCIILEISDHLRQMLLRGQVTEDKNSNSWFLQVVVTVTLNNRNKVWYNRVDRMMEGEELKWGIKRFVYKSLKTFCCGRKPKMRSFLEQVRCQGSFWVLSLKILQHIYMLMERT